jgi:hypothetical protein
MRCVYILSVPKRPDREQSLFSEALRDRSIENWGDFIGIISVDGDRRSPLILWSVTIQPVIKRMKLWADLWCWCTRCEQTEKTITQTQPAESAILMWSVWLFVDVDVVLMEWGKITNGPIASSSWFRWSYPGSSKTFKAERFRVQLSPHPGQWFWLQISSHWNPSQI